ncbi:hypothetical protein EPI10_032622 [Gossypium australe]|uniref:Secreted protein n=1 Tax=Gossypium australe TaxID=47621 RepID=A0A5B6X5A4_9ROSI|nr:hypothetical protein EPI10_032622 [Gossypium australe]
MRVISTACLTPFVCSITFLLLLFFLTSESLQTPTCCFSLVVQPASKVFNLQDFFSPDVTFCLVAEKM